MKNQITSDWILRQRAALDDVRDMIESKGARALLLAMPVVDDFAEIATDWEKMWLGILQTSVHAAYVEHKQHVDGVRLATLGKLLKTCGVVNEVDADLAYLTDEHEPVYRKAVAPNGDAYVVHEDTSLPDMNSHNGERRTPAGDGFSVWMLGDSVLYGYTVPDHQTLPWRLQAQLSRGNVRAFGVIGNELENINAQLASLPVRAGDVVVVQVHAAILRSFGSPAAWITIDPRDELAKLTRTRFVDAVHLTPTALQTVADVVAPVVANLGGVAQLPADDMARADELEHRIHAVLPEVKPGETVGTTVMSCNPFTNGHRWLCETAAHLVDHLVLHVMQDGLADLTFTPDVAVEMARLGTQDLPNVHVVDTAGVVPIRVFWPAYIYRNVASDMPLGVDTRRFTRFMVNAWARCGVMYYICGDERTDAVSAQNMDIAEVSCRHVGIRTIALPRRKFIVDGITRATDVRAGLLAGDELAFAAIPKACADYVRAHPEVLNTNTKSDERLCEVARDVTKLQCKYTCSDVLADEIVDKWRAARA